MAGMIYGQNSVVEFHVSGGWWWRVHPTTLGERVGVYPVIGWAVVVVRHDSWVADTELRAVVIRDGGVVVCDPNEGEVCDKYS